jgi:GPI ethanolamine phosphate transferase 3 subunit O
MLEGCHKQKRFLNSDAYNTTGNHGGGSEEEINAALFAHFSPACGVMTAFDGSEAAMTSDYAQTAFTSIHQIDLVPTISLLLGLPIPYANLGSLVPALALLDNPSQTVTALALNAAQVWRYFTMYSSTANQLPGMDELEERLKEAVALWKDGLAYPDGDDSTVYLKACSHFKMFLLEALQYCIVVYPFGTWGI